MTPAETRCLETIKALAAEIGRFPSTTQVCRALGYSSRATGYNLMSRLVEKGFLLPSQKVQGRMALPDAGPST